MALDKTKPLDMIALAGEISKGSQNRLVNPSDNQTIPQDFNSCKAKPPFLPDFECLTSGAERGKSEEFGLPLGTVAKNSSPFDFKGFFDRETGEIINNTPDLRNLARANRWAYKSIANKLLPDFRTSQCMVLRVPIPGQGLSKIDLCVGGTNEKAFVQGLQQCGSVWTCPVCAAKIAERRRQELKQAMALAKDNDWSSHFVTLTFPHGSGDDLNVILERMTKAYGKLSNGKYSVKMQLNKLLPDSELHGFVRAVEVTHGKNGFHPHVHMIVFTDSSTSSSMLDFVYSSAWKRACRLSDLPEPSDSNGCTVKDGSYASDYISKFGLEEEKSQRSWGVEDEMTKANSKISKLKGMTPFGFLKAVLDGSDDDYSPDRASSLFKVYAHAFKNKRQLHWSAGLRRKLHMNAELSDEALAESPEDERAILLASLSVEQWKKIRVSGQVPAMLTVAEQTPDKVVNFIDNLCRNVTLPKKTPKTVLFSPPEEVKSCPVCYLPVFGDHSCLRCTPKKNQLELQLE